MGKEYERLLKCLDCVRAKTDFRPKTALILGSGLGDYGEIMGIVNGTAAIILPALTGENGQMWSMSALPNMM